MGAQQAYDGKGVVAKKWARVRWEINQALLRGELPRDPLDHCKGVVFTKAQLAQAVYKRGFCLHASSTGGVAHAGRMARAPDTP